MSELSKQGGGKFFSLKSNPENRLKIVFGEEEDEKSEDATPVIRADEYHFISRNLVELENVGADVKGYNKVYEKNVAQLILSSRGGKPILTSWRFGLGRVAALSTDNGLQWSQELMSVDSGRLVSAMANWIVGDLEKGKKVRINSEDVSLGESVDISLVSTSNPQMEVKHYKSQQSPKLILTRSGLLTYSGGFKPTEGGFYGIRAVSEDGEDFDAAAVNYPQEFRNLGVDEDGLRRISAETGTRLYGMQELDTLVEDILTNVRESSKKRVYDKKELWTYFATAALIIYFLDAVARRLIKLLHREKDQSSTQTTTPERGE
jgi:hypothetical protein